MFTRVTKFSLQITRLVEMCINCSEAAINAIKEKIDNFPTNKEVRDVLSTTLFELALERIIKEKI